MAKTDIISLEFKETGNNGNSKQIVHRFNLRCTKGATEDDIWRWLNDSQATSATSIPVERPSGSTVTTGLPILDVYGNLPLDDIDYRLERDRDPQLYRVTATYRSQAGGGGGSPRNDTGATPTATYGFEYAPENIVYRQSLETIATFDQKVGTTSITAPDLHQAVNVQADGTVQGVQVPDPGSIVTGSFSGFPSFFTTARQELLAESRGKVNNATFNFGGMSYPVGSVRFLGASGNIATTGESTLDVRFGIRENVTGLEVAGLDTTGPAHIAYDGWDYFWVYYGKGVDGNGKPTVKPRGGYVERLFLRMDLNSLFS